MVAPLTETRTKKLMLLLEIVNITMRILAFKKKQDLDMIDYRKLKKLIKNLNECFERVNLDKSYTIKIVSSE